jgi:hypothetical protein
MVAGAVPLVRRQQQPPPMVTVMCGLILGRRRQAVVLGARLDPLSSTVRVSVVIKSDTSRGGAAVGENRAPTSVLAGDGGVYASLAL